MNYKKGDIVYMFPNNLYENGVKRCVVDEHTDGVIYTNDYTDNFPDGFYVFCRRGNALYVQAYLREIANLREEDNRRHEEDVREGEEYRNECDENLNSVIDVATENIGKKPVSFDRETLEAMAVLAKKPVNWGVLDLGSVRIVPSESKTGGYYPVTRDGCGCASFFFRMKKIGGKCKHIEQNFPE
jgi:hypothetical protein